MNTKAILQAVEHRPYPLPRGPWIMTQIWHELLFAHWPITPELLRPLIPTALSLDTFEGQAWVGIVPFRMSHVTLRGIPPIPWLSAFPELNVRTYVTVNGIPGVFFFSLDAGSPLAVMVARSVFHLPYFNANMDCKRIGDTIHYRSQRRHYSAPFAEYIAEYRPVGPVTYAKPGTLLYWFTERYCLYTVVKQSHVYRADIHHISWPLQVAEVETNVNTMAISQGIHLPDTQPQLHYSERQAVLIWPLHRM